MRQMTKRVSVLILVMFITLVSYAQSKKVAIIEPQGVAIELHKSIIRGSLRDAIANVDGYEAFTRTDIDLITKEMAFEQGGMVNDADKKKLGVLKGVDMLCAIRVTTDEGYLFVESQFIELETGKIHKSQSELMESSPLIIREGCVQLAAKLVGASSISIGSSVQRLNEDVLSVAVRNLLKNVPKNSRILIMGIVGNNEIQSQHIQSVISNEARGMIVIFEEQRQASIDRLREEYIAGNNNISIGQMVGANIIITGGVFGNKDTRRIVFRALDVETAQVVSASCALFKQTNTEYINNVEALIQKVNYDLNNNIHNGSSIAIINKIGTNKDADFIYDMIESNLVNQIRYKIVTRSSGDNFYLIDKEQKFQRSGNVSDNTIVPIGKFIGAKYILYIDFNGIKIDVKVIDVTAGSIITQETL